jgi:FMN phosphatase YigB (HAD superfamily)
MLRAVIFDVGETLVSEDRSLGEWAELLGVSRLTLFGVLGSAIERGQHHRTVYQRLRPELDFERLRAERRERSPSRIEPGDLYPDARACLESLRARGYWLALAGNQPASAEADLAALRLPVDRIEVSETLGFEKPSPRFFAHLIEIAGRPASEIAYVGDRLDNDVLPAQAAGMFGVFLRRGPWGVIHAERPEAARADLRLDSLAALPGALQALAETRS